MNLIKVDEQKCRRDGVCISECPVQILEFKHENSLPSSIHHAERMCIRCGHCVAVCPHGALTHQSVSLEQCISIKEEFKIQAEQMTQLVKARRSIRSYKNKRVDKELIESLIDTARYAPTGHNAQQVRWRVIYNEDRVKEIAQTTIDWMKTMIEQRQPLARMWGMSQLVAMWEKGYDIICRNAPHLIIAHANKIDKSAYHMCTIALSYLELIASAYGLGSCWAGFVNFASEMYPQMQQTMGLTDDQKCHGVLMLGYPKYKFQRIPPRNEVKINWME